VSASRLLVLLGVVWLTAGLVIAFVMRRRGHDFWVWFTLGAALGPLAVPLAIERARYHPIEYTGSEETTPDGSLDVLVGVDGSPESAAALDAVLRLFAGRVSSVTVAKVLDLDSGGAYTGSDAQTEAEELLESIAAGLPVPSVNSRVLFGRPDQALREYAEEHGVELIVVGPRGHGASQALFGSVTGRLVGGSGIPVFVGPSGGDREGRGSGRMGRSRHQAPD
jgi:nucleotide-binding universal stress UspA family protein